MACPAAELHRVAPLELGATDARLPSLNRAVRAPLPESFDRERADCPPPAPHCRTPAARPLWARRVVARRSSGAGRPLAVDPLSAAGPPAAADPLSAAGPLAVADPRLAAGPLSAAGPAARNPCLAVDFDFGCCFDSGCCSDSGCYSAAGAHRFCASPDLD